MSFASFNNVEQFFYWLKKQVENYAIHTDTTTNESLATIQAHNKPKLTYTKMRSQRMSAHCFSESDEGLITILHNYSIYKINEVTVLPYKVKSLLLHT